MMRDSDKLRMGMKIRTLRARRGMTQKELADAAGLGESALRSYELGARYPKRKHLESLAKALKVRPEAFEVYGIENELQFIHMLFNFEQTFKLEPDREGSPSLRSYGCGMVPKALMDWGKKLAQLEEGEITHEEYEDWKDTYNPAISAHGTPVIDRLEEGPETKPIGEIGARNEARRHAHLRSF